LERVFVNVYIVAGQEQIRDAINEFGTLDDYSTPDQVSTAREKVSEFVRGRADEISVPIPDDRLVEIMDAVDVEDILFDNSQRDWQPSDTPTGGSMQRSEQDNEISAVHDLFQRQ
jgi:hypothetical protein